MDRKQESQLKITMPLLLALSAIIFSFSVLHVIMPSYQELFILVPGGCLTTALLFFRKRLTKYSWFPRLIIGAVGALLLSLQIEEILTNSFKGIVFWYPVLPLIASQIAGRKEVYTTAFFSSLAVVAAAFIIPTPVFHYADCWRDFVGATLASTYYLLTAERIRMASWYQVTQEEVNKQVKSVISRITQPLFIMKMSGTHVFTHLPKDQGATIFKDNFERLVKEVSEYREGLEKKPIAPTYHTFDALLAVSSEVRKICDGHKIKLNIYTRGDTEEGAAFKETLKRKIFGDIQQLQEGLLDLCIHAIEQCEEESSLTFRGKIKNDKIMFELHFKKRWTLFRFTNINLENTVRIFENFGGQLISTEDGFKITLPIKE